MKSVANPRFWKCYSALPVPVQTQARKAHRLWLADHRHPSLRFKKVGKLWSCRVGDDHRALAEVRDDTAYWFWIGLHAEYEKLIEKARSR